MIPEISLPRGDRLLRTGVGLVAHFENLRCYVFQVLLVKSRSLDALGRIKLVIDDRVLLWSPRLGGFGLDVFDPALDTFDALFTVASVLRIEALTRV